MAEGSDILTRDLDSREFQHGVEQGFWELKERKDWFLYVAVFAPDGRAYLLELDCRGYGDDAIAGRFIDFATHQCVQAAWPQGNAVFQQWIKCTAGFFICWNQDRNGISHHSEWKGQKAWSKTNNQLLAYLNFMRQMLHLPSRGYLRQTAANPA